MVASIEAVRPRRTLGRKLLIAALVVFAALLFWQVVWIFSGSGNWEALSTEDGVTLYSQKVSGSTLERFKGVVKVHSSLRNLVALMTDPALCEDLGCHDWKIIESSAGAASLTQYTTSQFDMPFNLKTREYVSREVYSQDSRTKVIRYELTATPEKIADKSCCVRVKHMNNSWQYTPLPNGDVEVEYVMDMDEGGFIPDVLKNFFHPQFLAGYLQGLQSLLKKEEGRHRSADFIQEAGST
jgi:hypothetical protein